MRRLIIVLPMLLTACLLPYPLPPKAPPATDAQNRWFGDRNLQPLAFEVPPEGVDQLWSRAKAWLAAYADFKLAVVDSEILETYNPPSEALARYGYQVTRRRLESGAWKFTVRAVTGNAFAGNSAIAMGQSLAYYIRTGKDCPGCGGGRLGAANLL